MVYNNFEFLTMIIPEFNIVLELVQMSCFKLAKNVN